MTQEKNIKKEFKESFTLALPIVIGYFPIAIAFGLLSKNTQLSIRDTSMLSSLVYAGASQFMALDLINAGVSSSSIILATFLLNLRYMIMSASMSVEVRKFDRKHMPLIAFWITDETFSVISFNKEKISLIFIFTLSVLAYASWNIGTLVGYGVGEILSESLQASLSVGLYAMFAGLLFPEFKRSRPILFISLLSVVIYGLIFYSNLLSSGWDIIAGVLVSSLLGLLILKKTREGEVS